GGAREAFYRLKSAGLEPRPDRGSAEGDELLGQTTDRRRAGRAAGLDFLNAGEGDDGADRQPPEGAHHVAGAVDRAARPPAGGALLAPSVEDRRRGDGPPGDDLIAAARGGGERGAAGEDGLGVADVKNDA